MFPAEGLLGQINVELDGLKGVAAAMQAELESSFRSQVVPFNEAMQSGASIGGLIAGAEWQQLRATCARYIDDTSRALRSLDEGTDSVARAGKLIAETYGDADAFARARVDQIHEVITYAPPPPEQYGPYPPESDLR